MRTVWHVVEFVLACIGGAVVLGLIGLFVTNRAAGHGWNPFR